MYYRSLHFKNRMRRLSLMRLDTRKDRNGLVETFEVINCNYSMTFIFRT